MRFLTDDMHQIIEHLRNGARLIGPVTVSRKTGHGDRPWGFSDGRRANKMSVDALAARGLIVISDNGHAREAILAKDTGSPFGGRPILESTVAFHVGVGAAATRDSPPH